LVADWLGYRKLPLSRKFRLTRAGNASIFEPDNKSKRQIFREGVTQSHGTHRVSRAAEMIMAQPHFSDPGSSGDQRGNGSERVAIWSFVEGHRFRNDGRASSQGPLAPKSAHCAACVSLYFECPDHTQRLAISQCIGGRRLHHDSRIRYTRGWFAGAHTPLRNDANHSQRTNSSKGWRRGHPDTYGDATRGSALCRSSRSDIALSGRGVSWRRGHGDGFWHRIRRSQCGALRDQRLLEIHRSLPNNDHRDGSNRFRHCLGQRRHAVRHICG
jgi:hypothetical protein